MPSRVLIRTPETFESLTPNETKPHWNFDEDAETLLDDCIDCDWLDVARSMAVDPGYQEDAP